MSSASRRAFNRSIGDSYRFDLAYEAAEPDAPANVIGKFPAADPDSSRAAEMQFFRHRHEAAHLAQFEHAAASLCAHAAH